MIVHRAHESSCDMTAQPTVSALHIPTTHTFIPFQQFSISDGSGIRNSADDNNNKTAVHVVSVVAAVSGLCPAKSIVSMQQPAQIAQAVVAPTIIPTMVTPMAVQATNCVAPTTVTVANTISISNHLSVTTPQQHQQQAVANPGINRSALESPNININLSSQANGVNNNNGAINNHNNPHQSSPSSAGGKPNTACNPGSNNTNSSSASTPPSNNGSASVKPSAMSSKTSTSSSQSFTSEQNDDLVKPVFRDGELVLEVECGQNKAILYLSKLCQGSKGPCISFQTSWLTPNEFQFVSGRETAKDWKRSIRHHGKSLKLLLAKGILNVHPTMCDCDGCRQGATLTRKGEKRRVPNGERKPRKSSAISGVASNVDSSTMRPGCGSVPTAHLTPSAVKPEPKRCASDKFKVIGSAPQSSAHAESSVAATKLSQSSKTAPAQQPESLDTSRDSGNHRDTSRDSNNHRDASRDSSNHRDTSPSSVGSASASPLVSGATSTSVANSSARVANTSPLILAQDNTSSAIISTPAFSSSSAPSTPVGSVQPLSPFVSASSTPLSLHAVPNPLCIISMPAQCSPASVTTTSATPNGTTVTDFHPARPLSSQNTFQVASPGVLNGQQAESHPLSGEHNRLVVAEPSEDSHCNHQLGLADDLHNVGSENDRLFNNDDRFDAIDDVSEDEHLGKTSESFDISSDDQIVSAVGDKTVASETDTGLTPVQDSRLDQHDHVTDLCDKEQLHADVDGQEHPKVYLHADVDGQEHPKVYESSAPGPDMNIESDSYLQSSSSSSSYTSKTTLAVSAVSSTCSKPLTVSVSTANIKSEHIWVPPTLSPSNDTDSCHQPQHSDTTTRSPAHASVKKENGKCKEEKDSSTDKTRVRSLKPELCVESNEQARVKSIYSMLPPCSRDLFRKESHQAQDMQKKEMDTKREYNQNGSVLAPSVPQIKSECARDREKEERQRQKVKEERNRKEKEERNRKDKEREERREKERKEEKETERRRQEEAAKVQAESKSNKDMSATASNTDPSRRPPGGVAEAAAFSDYMRVLAAGHGHTFMPPTPGYVSSLFPLRPQESHIPTHVFHPMTPFGPQLSSIHKDPLLYQTALGIMPGYGGSTFGPVHPMLQRPPYTTQQSILDYQRSLATASYPWHSVYPYFLHEMASSSSSATTAAGAVKRSTTELEATMELNAKRMRLENRSSEYTSPWDYFAAAASQHIRAPTLAPTLPCGMESANMDKTAEFLRKRYMEYGPQAMAYLSALPDYARSAYHCVCADHREDDIRMWNVEDVCKFLSTLEGCAMYTDHFREQRVTGRILSILTADHLVSTMGMKLGPAVLLCEAVAKKLQDISKMANCEACRSIALTQPVHPMVLPL